MTWSRGFRVQKQRLELRVDTEKQWLAGRSELILLPTGAGQSASSKSSPRPPRKKTKKTEETLRLHFRQCTINNITVNGYDAKYELMDFLAVPTREEYRDLQAFYVHYRAAMCAAEQGELVVSIPKAVLENKGNISMMPSITVVVNYELHDATAGIRFIGPNSFPGSIPHMYTHQAPSGSGTVLSGGTGPRAWFPCIDSPKSRHTYEIEITVRSDSNNTAICSGELLGSRRGFVSASQWNSSSSLSLHARVKDKKYCVDDVIDNVDSKNLIDTITFKYAIKSPIAARSLGLAVGPFIAVADNNEDAKDSLPLVTHFCLPSALGGTNRTYDTIVGATTSIDNNINVYDSHGVSSSKNIECQKEEFRKSCTACGGAIRWMRKYLMCEYPFLSGEDTNSSLKIENGVKNVKKRQVEKNETVVKQRHVLHRQVFVQGLEVPTHPAHPPGVPKVHGLVDSVVAFSSLVILSSELIRPSNELDHTHRSELCQANGVAQQWFGGLMDVPTWIYVWLQAAFCGCLVNLYSRELCGVDHYWSRMRALNDIVSICAIEGGHVRSVRAPKQQRPLQPSPTALWTVMPNTVGGGTVAAMKAAFVAHMIERRVGVGSFRIVLRNLLKAASDANVALRKDLLQCTETPTVIDCENNKTSVNGNINESVISCNGDSGVNRTQHWLMTTQSVLSAFRRGANGATSAESLTKGFAQQWIYGSGFGAANFRASFNYHRKQNMAQVHLEQIGERFEGEIVVRVIEQSGSTDHIRRIERRRHDWSFICHTKVRKMRSKPKKNRNNNGDSSETNDTPILFVRIDPDLHWLRRLQFEQKIFMYTKQLSDGHGVVAHIDALQGLARLPLPGKPPSLTACHSINRVLINPRNCLPLRIAAAWALTRWQNLHAPVSAASTASGSWNGLNLLINFFKRVSGWFDESDQLRPNRFSATDISDYALKCSVPMAIASVRARNGIVPETVITFLLELLRENDNRGNTFGDGGYVAAVVTALASAYAASSSFGSTSGLTTESVGSPVWEIKRYLGFDHIRRSYNGVVAASCVRALCTLEIAGKKLNDSPYDTLCLLKKSAVNIVNNTEVSNSYPEMPWPVRDAAAESIVCHFFARQFGKIYGKSRKKYGNFGSGYSNKPIEIDSNDNNRENCCRALGWIFSAIASRAFLPRLEAVIWSELVRLCENIDGKNEGSYLIAALQGMTPITQKVVELLWHLMNGDVEDSVSVGCMFPKPFASRRLYAYRVFKAAFRHSTPPCFPQLMSKRKPANWAGAFSSFTDDVAVLADVNLRRMDLRHILRRRALIREPKVPPPNYYVSRHRIMRVDAIGNDNDVIRGQSNEERYIWRMVAPEKPKSITMEQLKNEYKGINFKLKCKEVELSSFSLS